MQYLYAHGLVSDEAARSVLGTIKLARGLGRPTLAVRFGTGIQLTAPPNSGDPKAIGTEQQMPERGSRRRGGGGEAGFGGAGGLAGPGGAGAGPGGIPGGIGGEAAMPGGFGGEGGGQSKGINPTIGKYTGDLGEKLFAAYKQRLLRGDYGDVLKKAASAAPAQSGGGQGGYGAAGGAAMAGFAGGGPGGPGGIPGVGPPDGGAGYGGGGGDDTANEVAASQIIPGLTMLGVGSQKDLLAKAKEEDLDVLVLFVVTVKPPNPKTNLIINETTASLLDARTGKKLYNGKKFRNTDVQNDRKNGKDDGLDKEVAKMFAYVDANLKLTDLPASLDSKGVLNRLRSLLKQPNSENPLPVLAEIRMYNAKGLLSEKNLGVAYKEILGVDRARKLATGVEADKQSAIARWLPQDG